jgi:hypothetical protein
MTLSNPLATLPRVATSTKPKFSINDPVVLWWTDEDAVSRCDRGVVVGFLSEWTSGMYPGDAPFYAVRWHELSGSPWVPLPHYSIQGESELRLDVTQPSEPASPNRLNPSHPHGFSHLGDA